MAQIQGILQQLNQNNNNNFGFGIVLPTPPPAIPALDNVWQWNPENGMPVFDNPNSEWERYLPPTARFYTSSAGRAFIRGMQRPLQIFNINCSGRGRVSDNQKSLLSMIYKADMKKIRVTHAGDYITVQKRGQNLIPFDAIYNQRAIRTTVGGGSRSIRPIHELITDINLNAARGSYGGGSFPCRIPGCLIGPLMTQQSVVRWGPGQGQTINVRKRFTCSCNDVVYLLHCHACLQNNLWTTYVGESDRTVNNIHSRFSNHIDHIDDRDNRARYPAATLPATVAAMLAGGPDPHSLLQDPYVHFRFIHTPADRRYTFLEGDFPSIQARRRCEFRYMEVCGNFVYNAATGSGSLNK